jgi:hypothetical protein
MRPDFRFGLMRGRKMRERAKLGTLELAGHDGHELVHDRPGEEGETVPSAEDAIVWAVAMAKLGFKV